MAEDFKVWLEELKSKCDIVSVISKYCHLVQKGRLYWTCCPFHMEKTPSMCIYDYEQVYHCYGCKEETECIEQTKDKTEVDPISGETYGKPPKHANPVI